MPKTSSQCLTCLLDDDGMKDTENVARASVDESDNVKILSLLHKQGHKQEGGIQELQKIIQNLLSSPCQDTFMFALICNGHGEKRYARQETMTDI